MIKKLKGFVNDFLIIWVAVAVLLVFIAGIMVGGKIESAHKIATATAGRVQVSVKVPIPGPLKTDQMKQEIQQATDDFADKVEEIVKENLKRPSDNPED